MKYTLLSVVLLLGVVIAGCKDDDSATSASLPTGPIKGRIILIDSIGNVTSDASGIAVTLEGTSLTTTTNSSGVWVLGDVPTRTYTIVYSGRGMLPTRETNFTFVGGDTVYHKNTTLWMPLQQRVQLTQITTANRVTFMGTLPVSENNYPAFALVGGISADSAALASSKTIGTIWAIDLESGSTTTSAPFSVGLIYRSALYSAGFTSGQRVYAAMHIVAVGDSYQNYQYYQDNRTGEYIFPAAGPVSEVVGFTVP